MGSTIEPTQEDIEYLNNIDKGVIGVDRPVVQHTVEESDWAPAWELEIEDGDHLRIDEQGMD